MNNKSSGTYLLKVNNAPSWKSMSKILGDEELLLNVDGWERSTDFPSSVAALMEEQSRT